MRFGSAGITLRHWVISLNPVLFLLQLILPLLFIKFSLNKLEFILFLFQKSLFFGITSTILLSDIK